MDAGPWVATATALLTGFVEIHRAAGPEWRHGAGWALPLLLFDVLLACLLAVVVDDIATFGRFAGSDEVALVAAGALGPRLLYLIPVPGRDDAARSLISARRFAIDQIEQARRARRTRFVYDEVEVAAARLSDAELSGLVEILLEDCQRAGRFPQDTNVPDLVGSIVNDAIGRETRVRCLVQLVLKYGGRPMCLELIRRSSSASEVQR